MPEQSTSSPNPPAAENHEKSILLAREVIQRFQLSDLEPLLRIIEFQTKKNGTPSCGLRKIQSGKEQFSESPS
jgi:hypothetical protein